MSIVRALLTFTVLFAAQAANAQTCCIRGDVNVDFSPDIDDVAAFVQTLLDPASALPRAMCAADANADGEVNGADVPGFVAILLDPAIALFDYGPALPDVEAAQIGFEMLGAAGPLLVPADIYARIDADLDAIRAHTPALAAAIHSPAWPANRLIVKVINGLPLDDYQCLNAYYQVIDEDVLFPSGNGVWYVLTLAGQLNIAALASVYQALPEVEFAEPDFMIGGAKFWTPTPLANGAWRWDVDDGFLDCFDGCDCHRLYTFRTSATGVVSLLSYQETGQPWCEF